MAGRGKRDLSKKKQADCERCGAKCCRYFALEIDTPRTLEDFDEIRWYLAHKKVVVFVDKRKWFLQVFSDCSFLTRRGECAIYEDRPLICRDHPADDCEGISNEFGHRHVFRSVAEIDGYTALRFGKKRKTRPFAGKKTTRSH